MPKLSAVKDAGQAKSNARTKDAKIQERASRVLNDVTEQSRNGAKSKESPATSWVSLSV